LAAGLAIILFGCQPAGALPLPPGTRTAAFAKPPTAVREDAGLRISFATSAPVDCAVWIEDRTGRTVRHLAAGMLGANAPAPLAAGKLEQSLLWDGKDDAGRQVLLPPSTINPPPGFVARVGLGLSARFDRVIGSDPQWLGNIWALAVGKDGELFAYCSRGICVLDREGRYLRQIVPAPAGMGPERLKGLEPVQLADGSTYYRRGYSLPGSAVGSMAVLPSGELLLPGPGRYPRNLTRIGTDGSVPAGAFSQRLTSFQDIGLLYLACAPDGKTLYFSGAEPGYLGDDDRRASYRHAVYRLDLTSAGPAELLTGDDENGGPPGYMVARPKGLAVDSAGRLYVCNYARPRPAGSAPAAPAGGEAAKPAPTGDISVYTPRGGLLKSIPVDYPQQVAVHPKTGQIYVLAGREEAFVRFGVEPAPSLREARLLRLSPEGRVEQEIKIEDPFIRARKAGTWPEYRLAMAADFSGERPVVWLGLAFPPAREAKWSLLRIEDNGRTFDTPRDVCPKPREALLDRPFQICLDRERDIVYANDDSRRLLRFRGDGSALSPLVPEYEKDGKRRPYSIIEAAAAPGGDVYALVWSESGLRQNWLVRFDPEGRAKPLAVGDETGGVRVDHAMKAANGSSARGLGVGPDGRVYVVYHDDARPADALPTESWDRGFPMTQAVARLDAEGRMDSPRLVAHLRVGGQGVRADRRGNVYVAENILPVGAGYPHDFVGVLDDPTKRAYPARLPAGAGGEELTAAPSLLDPYKRPDPVRLASVGVDPLLRYMGSLFKFGPEGGWIAGLPDDDRTPPYRRPASDLWKPVPGTQWFLFNNHRLKVTGALWQYHGMSPVPAQYQGVPHVEQCVCGGGRFDLDEFDRIFVPDVLRGRVTVLDSEGNVLAHIGRSGNRDSAAPDLAFAEPGWLAAAADRLYVADGSACRIVRVKLGYRAEAACPAAPGQ